jgi:GAF domain-containing protein
VPARSVEERAEACLESLLQVTPFQAGWIGLLDPERREHVLLAHQGYDDPIRAWLTGARESGPGLTGLTDRVDALAGTMRLVSPPGCGTRLRVRLRISPGSGRGREGGKSGEAIGLGGALNVAPGPLC